MSIHKVKRKKGHGWKARVYINGRAQYKTFDRKIDAEKWEREQLQERDNPTPQQEQDILFSELAEMWLIHHVSTQSPATQRRYQQILNLYLLPGFGRKVVQEITVQDVGAWFYRLHTRSKDISLSTCNQILTRLKTLLNWGVRRQLIFANPAHPIDKVTLPINADEELHVWSLTDAERFLTWCQEHKPCLYRVAFCALNTGMRLGELTGLLWDKVDFRKRVIEVSRNWCVKSKALKEYTKGKRKRLVGINQLLFQLLSEMRLADQGNGHVFVREDGRRLPSNTYTEQVFRPACRRSNVPEIRFHDLRHTYAAFFMWGDGVNGGSIYDLQTILGHSDIQTTQKYLRFAPQHAERLVQLSNTVSIGRSSSGKVQHLFIGEGKNKKNDLEAHSS